MEGADRGEANAIKGLIGALEDVKAGFACDARGNVISLPAALDWTTASTSESRTRFSSSSSLSSPLRDNDIFCTGEI